MVSVSRRVSLFLNVKRRTVLIRKRSITSGAGGNDFLFKTSLQSLGIGSAAGALGSLAGMGGGFVMIPLMTSKSLLKLSQHQGHGTSLFAVAATGMAGCCSYATFVQWDLAAAIALTGMVSSRLGARYASSLSGVSLKNALGVLMILMAPAVHAKRYFLELSPTAIIPNYNNDNINNQNDPDQEWSHNHNTIAHRVLPASVIGLGSGFMAGLFGVGGGVIVVPALTVFTSCDHYQALATSLTAMVLPAAVGTWTHFKAGNVSLPVAPALALGACMGAYVGGQLAQTYAHEAMLQWGFSGLLMSLGIRTLVKTG